jgi:AhpD family alkylhydroperoxidase
MPAVPLIDPSQNEALAGLEAKSKHPNLFFRALAHKPAVLSAFPALYSAIMGPGAVDRRIKIIVYLATSYANNCPFCVWGNEPTARKLGLNDAQLQTLQSGGEAGFEGPELAAIRYARELARTSDAAESRDELAAHFSPEQIVELTLTSAIANFTNRVNNGLEILPD